MGEARRRGKFEERIRSANFECIICRASLKASERSDEHVIPDSLNGYYHIYSVCQSCNSNMGASIDGVLLNHKLTQLYRFSEKMSGKSGKVPNPFSEVKSIKGNPKVNIKTEISDSGQIVYKYLPSVETEEHENGTLKSFRISVDARDQQKVEGIRKKIIKRNNLKEANFISEHYIESVIESPQLEGRWEIDTLKFKLGLLKIAYEFGVDSISNYFNDPLAKKISEILKNSSYERVNELKIGSGFDKELFEKVENIFDIEKKRHILMLLSMPQGLICFIKIDNLFHIGVQLSENKYMPFERSVIGINDLEVKTFTKKSLFELISENSGLTYTKLGYWFANLQELSLAQFELKSPEFQYVTQSNGNAQLYQKNGKKHKLSWSKLLLNASVDMDFKDNLMIQRFSFSNDLGLFVKSIKSGKLYEFRDFELSREFSKV